MRAEKSQSNKKLVHAKQALLPGPEKKQPGGVRKYSNDESTQDNSERDKTEEESKSLNERPFVPKQMSLADKKLLLAAEKK